MASSLNLEALRVSYDKFELSDELAAQIDNPTVFFNGWLTDAISAGTEVEPNAMTLATASKDGFPSARMVLCKGVDERGFRFFTNYTSAKGTQLAENPNAALVFYWASLHRSVRVCGTVEKLNEEESAHYFDERPRGSQLGAWASPHQSSSVASRKELDEYYEECETRFQDAPVPKPDFWGGYIVRPTSIEFWQGRRGRVHDRIKFTRNDMDSKEWSRDRLSP
jgi:pyridoxamine 5'-phosphate oxidase